MTVWTWDALTSSRATTLSSVLTDIPFPSSIMTTWLLHDGYTNINHNKWTFFFDEILCEQWCPHDILGTRWRTKLLLKIQLLDFFTCSQLLFQQKFARIRDFAFYCWNIGGIATWWKMTDHSILIWSLVEVKLQNSLTIINNPNHPQVDRNQHIRFFADQF